MSRYRFMIFAGLGMALLIVLIVTLLWLFLKPDVYRDQVRQGLSETLGMEVTFGPPVRFGWFPGLQIILEAVHVRNDGLEIASARKVALGVRPLSLLRGAISIDSIVLSDASIFIERGQDGRFNFQSDRQLEPDDTVLDLRKLSLSNADVHFAGQQSWRALEAFACDIEVRGLHRSPGRGDFAESVAFSGELACGDIETEAVTLSDVKVSLTADAGVISFEPISLHMLDADGTGRIVADFSGAVPQWWLQFSLPGFPIEAFFNTLSATRVATGLMHFTTDLSMQGATVSEIIQTMAGPVSLRGSDLTLETIDLDEALARLQSSRNFNLIDVGAFFLAGPLGLAVTRGYEFASLLDGSGSTSAIPTLVSDWQIEHGIMRSRDVAMATHHNRIALQGSLDFVDREFDDVVVAWVDSSGCIRVQQKVKGTFAEPVVETPGALESLARPTLELLKQGRDLLSDAPCEVFYSGSVPDPM